MCTDRCLKRHTPSSLQTSSRYQPMAVGRSSPLCATSTQTYDMAIARPGVELVITKPLFICRRLCPFANSFRCLCCTHSAIASRPRTVIGVAAPSVLRTKVPSGTKHLARASKSRSSEAQAYRFRSSAISTRSMAVKSVKFGTSSIAENMPIADGQATLDQDPCQTH